MEFVERKTAPKKDNKYYYSNTNYFYPQWENQCTWYVVGRQLELGVSKAKLKANLPSTNAENWYHDTTFEKRSYPNVGDIIVYSAGKRHHAADGMGHVAIVEYVYDNGNLRISESGANMKFQTRVIKPPYNFYLNVKHKSNYKLDGFIHIQDYDETKWIQGDYVILYNKYLRTSATTNANNKVSYKSLKKTNYDWPNITKPDKLGKARFKVGVKMNIIDFTRDSKNNLWGRCKTEKTPIWLCVYDKSGDQVKKV